MKPLREEFLCDLHYEMEPDHLSLQMVRVNSLALEAGMSTTQMVDMIHWAPAIVVAVCLREIDK